MSESDSYPKAEFFRKPNLSKNSPNVPKWGLNTRHDNREVTWSDVKWMLFNFSESRICPNIYRMFRSFRSFRSVDWTHDMIIVKWHLFIWHERKLCALTNAPPIQSTQVNDYQRYSMLGAQVYVLYPRQFIFALSWNRRSFLQVLQSIRRIFWKIFCVSDDDKCYGENMS